MAENTIEFDEDGRIFTCTFIPLDADHAHDLGTLSAFYDIWNRARRGTDLPRWKDFSFSDFRGWHGKIRLAKIDAESNILCSRITGEIFMEYCGSATFSELVNSDNPPSQASINQHLRLREFIESGYMSFGQGVIPRDDGSLRPLKSLELPLSDDGKRVTHFLAAVEY